MQTMKLKVGDRVKYSDSWLDKLGAKPNEKCRKWQGVVFDIRDRDGFILIGVRWEFGTSCHLETERLVRVEKHDGESSPVQDGNKNDSREPARKHNAASNRERDVPKTQKRPQAATKKATKKPLQNGGKGTSKQPTVVLRRDGRDRRKEAVAR